jgi:hypothetical protein
VRAPVAFVVITVLQDMLKQRKDEAAEEAVAVAAGSSDGAVRDLQAPDLLHEHLAASLVLYAAANQLW